MARAGSSSTRTSRKSAADKAAEAEAQTNQSTETLPEAALAEAPEATKEATVSTDTIDEAQVDATDASVNTETASTADQSTTETEKPAEIDLSGFENAVAAVLNTEDPGYDQSTGDVPLDKVDAVKTAFRELPGAKAKNKAKEFLTDALREAIGQLDVVRGAAVMQLSDAIKNTSAATRVGGTERKPVDPKAAFVDRMTTLHLAYALVRSDVPEGIDADEVYASVDEKVEALGDQADTYFGWVNSTAEDKGDEPEVDAVVKAAVKAAQGKASRTAKSGSGATRAPGSSGERRNVRTHIGQAFDKHGKESGDFLKVSEIAKTITDEYPDGACSPGAVTAALKSAKGVEGYVLVVGDGPAGARKL